MIGKVCRVIYNSLRFIGHHAYKSLLGVTASTRIDESSDSSLQIGRNFRTRRNVELNIRKNAKVTIGDNVFLNSGCMITARQRVVIGSNTIFGPNVIVYDHDHVIRDGHVIDNEFVTEEVIIGSNVWIGAGAIILKGSVIEDNCIIAAGSVVKGKVESGNIMLQKRNPTIKPLQRH